MSKINDDYIQSKIEQGYSVTVESTGDFSIASLMCVMIGMVCFATGSGWPLIMILFIGGFVPKQSIKLSANNGNTDKNSVDEQIIN